MRIVLRFNLLIQKFSYMDFFMSQYILLSKMEQYFFLSTLR